MNEQLSCAEELIKFINESPTCFHAVESVIEELKKNGFEELNENSVWNLKKQGKYYIVKNQSAIAAFSIGNGEIEKKGFKIIGSHTDSPSFKIKPFPEIKSEGYIKLNTEIYGSPIVSTWFDRPLSLAGRVSLKSNNVLRPEIRLINIKRPILIIPNLAIHMNREVNKGMAFNYQKDTLPILGLINEELEKEDYLLSLIAENLNIDKSDILDFDLYLYDYEKGCIMGANKEFISSGRLDDLAMIYASLKALINSNSHSGINMMICFDNEEVGSLTKQGANSNFLNNVIERVIIALDKNREDYYRTLSNSFIISSDLAHAIHPNTPEKSDPINKPKINKGPVIKISSSQSYASDSYSSGVFIQLCNAAEVPVQKFVNRSDERGGTTIGPITSSKSSINCVDIGTPILAMHSIRELGGTKDQYYITKVFKKFYSL